MRDPALLEFAGLNLIKSSVFPLEPNGTQKVRITYEHLLPAVGDRVDYVLPRTESVDYHVPWTINVRIKSKQPVSTVYSPSHPIETQRQSANVVSARLSTSAQGDPGSFRLSYLVDRGEMAASLFTYPDASGDGGYFLLLAGLPAEAKPEDQGIQREVTLVIDRSGSMNGEKIEQARQAALQVVAGLNDGERFNLITYSDSVDLFSAEPVVKDPNTEQAAREYISRITARGGTNLHDALLQSLQPRPAEGTLPLVLFLTDGLPTVGQTSEVAIREVASKSNPHDRRVFTFGVGVDVNTPLLEGIATATRAKATFVLPGDGVEVKVGDVF
ncbi:MAG: vWA domain-containing protein, partial [Planctomycetaceae bacterium]